MFRGALGAVVVCLATLSAAASPASADQRPPLLKLATNGRLTAVRDSLPRDLPGPDRSARPAAQAPAAKAAATNIVNYTIGRMLGAHAIDRPTASKALASWRKAVRTRRALSGTAGYALGDAISNIVGITARKQLTPSRLAVAMLTVERNAEYFAHAGVPSVHQRVMFGKSDLVWEYYPGQGLQLQVLATFGIANGLWRAKLPGHLKLLLDQMLALKSNRAGGSAWEYFFSFDGGQPPWSSAMSQATGIEAFTRGAAMLKDRRYLKAARSALALFRSPTPAGVRTPTRLGPWYVMYSFAPSVRILNGFLQSLVGLNELAVRGKDRSARALFTAGEPVARAAIPSFMSRGWSYYSPGEWSDESYHELTAGFLGELCRRTSKSLYCRAQNRFDDELKNPPHLEVTTKRLKPGKPTRIGVWVSKPAWVTVTVTAGGKQIGSSANSWYPGNHAIGPIRIPRGSRNVSVRVRGTDASGRSRSLSTAIPASVARIPGGN